MTYRSIKMQVNGINLNVIDEGDSVSPVIVLLHGFPEFSYGWKNQIPFFLKNGFRVLVPDQRGYNLSDKPSGVASYSTDILTRDIVELIKIQVGKKVYLVGHDWGAAIAWRLATNHPELIYKLVIINVPHPSVMKKTLRKNLRQIMKSWYILFFQIPFLPETIMASSRYKILCNVLLKSSNPELFHRKTSFNIEMHGSNQEH